MTTKIKGELLTSSRNDLGEKERKEKKSSGDSELSPGRGKNSVKISADEMTWI